MSDQERWAEYEAEGLAMHTPEFERQIAETMAERERGDKYWDSEIENRAERRERIAGVVLLELIRQSPEQLDVAPLVAVEAATRLVDALDAAEARDREATK